MNGRVKLAAGVAVAALVTGGGAATAIGGGASSAPDGATFRASLIGYEEVPAISTAATGKFRAVLEDGTLRWSLEYAGIEGGPVLQAHIHFGQRDVNGGISAFLCSNLPDAPAGVQECPAPPASISGTVSTAQVVGPNEQGIAPGEFAELARAMAAGITYANVHSETFPAGEIRGQIRHHDR